MKKIIVFLVLSIFALTGFKAKANPPFFYQEY